MNIFQELVELKNNINFEMERLVDKSGDYYNYLCASMSFFELVDEYKNELSWLKSEGTKDRARVYFRSGYKIKAVEKEMGISYEAAKVSVRYIQNKFMDKMGRDTIAYIKKGDIKSAFMNFLVASGTSTKDILLPSSVMEIMPQKSYFDKKLSDCYAELYFLYVYSTEYMRVCRETLDDEALSMIMWYLDNTSAQTLEQRLYIMEILSGVREFENIFEDIVKMNI